MRVGLHAVLDEPHVHAQEAVDLPHPFAVAAGQVVVDRDDVHVLAGKRVQVAGKRGHERLAFAGLHFRDLPVVQGHAADELHVEVPQPRRAHAGLAHGREGFGQDGVQILAAGDPFLESRRQRAQLVVRFLLHAAFESVDALHGGLVALELLALAQREELRKETCHVSAVFLL